MLQVWQTAKDMGTRNGQLLLQIAIITYINHNLSVEMYKPCSAFLNHHGSLPSAVEDLGKVSSLWGPRRLGRCCDPKQAHQSWNQMHGFDSHRTFFPTTSGKVTNRHKTQKEAAWSQRGCFSSGSPMIGCINVYHPTSFSKAIGRQQCQWIWFCCSRNTPGGTSVRVKV